MELSELNTELSDLFSSIEFEENGGIHITGADWYADDLKLEFAINTGVANEHQLWEAQISGVRDELIKSDWVDELVLTDEHPLLWQFNNVQTDLYFSKSTQKPFELLNSILETHLATTKGWYDLQKFINSNSYLSLIELCKSSNALFAKGPKKILELYAKILDEHQMKPNLFGDRSPKRWTGEQWIEETEPLNVLLIGKSYVIAEQFDFERI